MRREQEDTMKHRRRRSIDVSDGQANSCHSGVVTEAVNARAVCAFK